MDFQKQDIIKFINIALQTTPGDPCENQTSVKELPKSFDGLTVDASVGKGRAAAIPWVSFTAYDQKITNGIYPVLLFYQMQKILVVAYGVSVTNTPLESWNISGVKTLEQFFKDRNVVLNKIEKKYNSSYVHSDFPVKIVDGKLDEGSFDIDGVYKSLSDICVKYKKRFEGKRIAHEVEEIKYDNESVMKNKKIQIPFKVENIISSIKTTGLLYEKNLIKRYVYALLTKPFVILSGLAGSGKTQLALAFAKAMVEDEKKQMCVVSVGSDWTNREPLLGYPNALNNTSYIKPENGVLDLLIESNKPENSSKPYFLILDEMNLSYVERYFADFLSAMESHVNIPLWKGNGDDVPQSVSLSKNLFIIGTINVDETTYMFSPKVLDRANVIEFKVGENDMEDFLINAPVVDMSNINGSASNMAADFVRIASESIEISKEANDVLKKFFKQLKTVNAEFGYRTATEIGRFISLSKDTLDVNDAIDVALVQKLLPKLHGSRKKIVPVLKELWKLCGAPNSLEEHNLLDDLPIEINYKLTADKVLRMYRCAIENGFTSFAEA